MSLSDLFRRDPGLGILTPGHSWRQRHIFPENDDNGNSGGGGNNRGFGRPIRKHLPLGLQWFIGRGKNKQLSPFASGLIAGAGNLGNIMANPGGFQPGLSQAIAPRLAMESEMINRNTQGNLASTAGALSRSGQAGSGFAAALQASIEQAGSREQAQSLRQAELDSAQLYRQDLDRVMEAYSMLLDWYKPKGRGGTANSAAKAANRAQTTSSAIGAVGSIVGGLAAAYSDKRLKRDITPIKPVMWEWNRKAESVGKTAGEREVGLLAQDVEKVWPDAVGELGGYKTVDYQKVATRLAGIVGELQRKVAA